MKSKEWLCYFEKNRTNRPEPPWNVSCPLDKETRKVFARSLAHFQLGESGEGKFLLRQAHEQAKGDADYIRALALFIGEEQEHARLLEGLVRRFGGEPIRQHWTHAGFRLARRMFGLNFELQVLVIAEIIGTAYYRLLRARDPVLDEVCRLFLRDEARHLEFHASWLREAQATWLPAERAGWSLQFQLLFTVALNAAWFDHRRALAMSGRDRQEFVKIARGECIQFLRQLEQTGSDLAPTPAFT